jgi:WD40 repeat protein
VTKRATAHPEEQAETERIERWRWMLEQDVPIIGGWMHRRVTAALNESALAGNWLAAQSLAVVFVFHEEADVRKMAGQTLGRINYSTGIDAVWGAWAETRNPGLEQIVLGYKRLANHPASIRLLSALRTSLEQSESLSTVTRGSADLVPPLIQACEDRDPKIAARAKEAILKLSNPASVDAVCQAWQSSRTPFLAGVLQQAGYVAQKPASTRVLSALKISQLETVMKGASDLVGPLVAACQDADQEIAARARQCLPFLNNQAAVDEFCRLWSETRSPLLEAALLQAGYKARGPVKERLLVALKTGHLTVAEKATPQGLPFLLEATQDPDETIRLNARKALAHLQDEETRDALCGRVIETNDDLSREIALTSGYAPRAPETRALFYFLTEQWPAYDALDFDQSMLRAIYEGSSAELRQRIAARVQVAGRTDYLTILAGVDYRTRVEQVNPNEAALLIRVLDKNGEYQRLWQLAPELALPFSLEIIQILAKNAWRPAEEADQPVFDELVRLSRQPILLSGPDLVRALPLAHSRATLKVKGRINDVAFSPTRPVLAIATSQRKVVLWNFQTASIERVWDTFIHSVGKVSFTPQDLLLCAERTNSAAMCSVYAYGQEEAFQLTAHEGTVTVLEPVGDELLLTAGRDGHAFLWDLALKKKIAEKEYSFWARSAAISPDRQYAALLHDRLNLVRLPELTIVPGTPFLAPRVDGFKHGVAQNATFSPDGKFLLAGQYNGQVGMYYHTSHTQHPRKAVVTQHSQPIRGITFLPEHPIVITAGAEGQVRFIRWPEVDLMGKVYSPEGTLTSLRVSRQGAFMATGTNEASLVLWDLRVLDIPDLFAQPLATATHEQISTVLALGEYNSLPDPVRNGLKFLRLMLQYRFRYDIQIDEAPRIQYGEFDIILDEV